MKGETYRGGIVEKSANYAFGKGLAWRIQKEFL